MLNQQIFADIEQNVETVLRPCSHLLSKTICFNPISIVLSFSYTDQAFSKIVSSVKSYKETIVFLKFIRPNHVVCKKKLLVPKKK